MNHWRVWPEFVKAELAAGGPDPQISIIERLCAGATVQERVWMMGCYGAHHCVPSAWAVWSTFRMDEVVKHPEVLREWLGKMWAALPVRPEMKNHRMLDKRTKCLWDFAVYAQRWNPNSFLSYDQLWGDIIPQVKYFDRYMAIKVLEMLRRFGGVPHIEAPDMRAKGGWSPRTALAWLWPEQAMIIGDRNRNSATDVVLVEEYARRTRDKLAAKGVDVNLFQLQVLLCEYKEAVHGGYYPGASHDEELVYMGQTATKFDYVKIAPIFRARTALFKPEYLGEVGGWNGPRKEKYVVFKTNKQEALI